MRRRSLVFALLLALGLAAAGAAFAANGGVTPPSPRSPNAERINDTYYLILGITGGIFLLVETALILFIVRYRNRGRPRAVEGPQVIGHTRLELIWTVVPVLILAAIAGFVFYKLPGIKDVPGAQAGERLAIRVEGHQFYWRFVYPDGTVAVDRLRVPADRVVTMSVTAPDVVHSWWVPELGGKIDAIPGETTHTWFRARRPGVYKGKCAEFCGIQHAVMTASVEVLPRAEYARWLAERRGAATGLGEETFAGVCAKCHGARGQGGIGPALAGNRLIGDRKAIEPIIRNGTGLMPPVGRNWDDQQLNAVIAYMGRTLREESGGGG